MAQTTRTRARVCLLAVSLILLPTLGAKYPKTTILGVVNRRFSSQAWKILKISYCRNYFIDVNQILHNDRDHRIVIVGGPNSRITNPRWTDGRHFGKTVKLPFLCNWHCSTDFGGIWYFGSYWHLSAHRPLKFQIFECRHLEKSQKSRYLRNGLTDLYEIWYGDAKWVCPPLWPLKS